MVLIRDARDIRVRREDIVMMGDTERFEDPGLLALRMEKGDMNYRTQAATRT